MEELPWFTVTLRVEIERHVQAKNEEDAMEKVDTGDMMHELKNYKVDEEYIVERFG